MPRPRSLDDLSVDELRQLLVEKRRAERQKRLEQFRRTGRVIAVAPQPEPQLLQSLRTELQPSQEELAVAVPRRRTWMDRFLLVVELAAVAGLIWIAITGINVLNNLNKEVSNALVQPTLTPTALIRAVVLPSGHTPPDAPGGAQPNEAEIPEHLRPLVQNLASLPMPTASPQQAVRLQIPAIKVDHPVVQGDGWEQLKKGIAQHVGTPNPGQKGNMVFSAHNDIFGQIFRDLDLLKPGDSVIVFTNQRTYTYLVQQTQIVEPTRVDVMEPTNEAVVTLVSCYPYRVDNRRIVVTAALQEN